MTIADFWNAGRTAALASHLWQSTAVAIVAWAMTCALRHYPARVRFFVWGIASIKFLLPFTLLTSLGAHWAQPRHPVRTMFYTIIEEFSGPLAQGPAPAAGQAVPAHSIHAYSFAPWLAAGLWLCGCVFVLSRWMRQNSLTRRVFDDAQPLCGGREVDALRCAEAKASMRKPIPVVQTSRAMEPGIFGVFRPLLLWPAGLSEHLDDAQIRAIVEHELEHVRRRDNLTMAFHTMVEALFWFHPAVWWMDSKMKEERERACDEKVIEQSAQPEKYAESILKVCAFCLESPLPCVAGVSGTDLKQRILRIMTYRTGVALSFGRRALLASVAGLAFTLPIGLGVLHGQTSAPDPGAAPDVPKFDVASVKPATSSADGMHRVMLTPDGVSFEGTPTQMLLHLAFNVEDDRIIGAPSWVQSSRYDIEAKVAPEDAPKLEKLKSEDRRAMLIPLLVERFNLKYHHEMRELPMYSLVLAKGGPKLTESKVEPEAGPGDPPRAAGPPMGRVDTHGRMMMGPGNIESSDTTLSMLAHALAPQLGHSVEDKTGLTGRYDYKLSWTPENAPPMGPGGLGGPAHGEASSDAAPVSLFTAIQEQLGLKLVSEKGNVDVIVIDHIDPPSAN